MYSDEGLIAEATQNISLQLDGSVTTNQAPNITTQYGVMPDSNFSTGVLFIKTKNSLGLNTVAYYHHDHLQTPLQATDKAGNIVWSATYNVFGQATITTPNATELVPTIESNLRLPGQYEDTETGLHYNFNRYYDPQTGRYISQDPIGLAGGVNRFSYVNHNPLNNYDPSGLLAFGDPLPQGFVDTVAGFGDGIFNVITFGVGDLNELRNIVGINGGVNTSCDAYTWANYGGIVVGTVALGGAFTTSWKRGWEISFGRNWRIAPWGNRTNNPYGKWPHYHRRGSEPGQGIGRHRPWERKSPDKSWMDRF